MIVNLSVTDAPPWGRDLFTGQSQLQKLRAAALFLHDRIIFQPLKVPWAKPLSSLQCLQLQDCLEGPLSPQKVHLLSKFPDHCQLERTSFICRLVVFIVCATEHTWLCEDSDSFLYSGLSHRSHFLGCLNVLSPQLLAEKKGLKSLLSLLACCQAHGSKHL